MEEDLAHLQGFLDSAPDAMLVVGADGKIVLANALAHDLFVAEASDLVGLCVDELVPESLRGSHAARREAFHDSPSARPMGEGSELQATRRDGTEFPTEISLSPLPRPGPRLVLAAVRDLTNRKAAEQKLVDARLELERRQARERQALEINDSVVQSLAVAEYRMDLGDHDEARKALRGALASAREIITDLLAAPGQELDLRPGDLRRGSSARLRRGH